MIDLKHKKLLIYDLDGTLVDTRQDIARSANHMRVSFGLPYLESEVIWGYVGKGLLHLVAECLQTEDPKDIRRGAQIYREYYAKHMLDATTLYPGVREFLDTMKGARQAVITNKPEPFGSDLLHELLIYRYFFKVIGGNSGYHEKPDPSSTLDLMKMAKADKDEVLWIGDSGVDIETARAAGVDVIVLTHGFVKANKLKAAKPDAIFKNFRDLLQFAHKAFWTKGIYD